MLAKRKYKILNQKLKIEINIKYERMLRCRDHDRLIGGPTKGAEL